MDGFNNIKILFTLHLHFYYYYYYYYYYYFSKEYVRDDNYELI